MSPLSRRALLAGAALLGMGMSVVAQPLMLSEAERRTLTLAARTMFPHPLLSDAPYRGIIDFAFPDSDAAKVAAARGAVARLDADGPPFAARAEAARHATLAPLIADPFFQGLRVGVLIGLYADLGVTRRFGYQGPSIKEGGYSERGFDALPWLPSPKGLEASRWPI